MFYDYFIQYLPDVFTFIFHYLSVSETPSPKLVPGKPCAPKPSGVAGKALRGKAPELRITSHAMLTKMSSVDSVRIFSVTFRHSSKFELKFNSNVLTKQQGLPGVRVCRWTSLWVFLQDPKTKPPPENELFILLACKCSSRYHRVWFWDTFGIFCSELQLSTFWNPR